MRGETSLQISEGFKDLQNEEDNYLVCEACGKQLEGRNCKLKCTRCGYFRSCSDLF